MRTDTLRFLSLVFVALALGASLAHLLALPNKIHLPAEDYLTVQGIYRGWALLGFVVAGALLSTLMLVIRERGRAAFRSSLVAFLCIVAAQIIFWVFTFPANQQTLNWTYLPDNWASLRTQWEYSHAAGALLNFAAFLVLVRSTLSDRADRETHPPRQSDVSDARPPRSAPSP